MNKNVYLLAALLASAAGAPAAHADMSRVSAASLPIPLPASLPMPPDRLRAHNAWNLPMMGDWRFQLTHGHIVDRQFVSSAEDGGGATASSNETNNTPRMAFDGNPGTRWCADSSAVPQWIQADLKSVRHLTGVTLAWETPGNRYRGRIEGSPNGKDWTALADFTAAPGIGDGPVTIPELDVRYVRLTITGTQSGWASLREVQLHLNDAGQDVVWKPDPPLAPAADPHRDDFAQPGFDDAAWNTLAVPSNWEMAGYSIPTYNSVDDTVGLYRRWVMVPKAFAGRRIFWRFDGALEGAEVFVNGKKAGYHESGYTAFDVELTGLVQPGKRNLFAVRLSKTTPSSDAETGDFQCMGGIYRETSLIAVPKTHIHDITLDTPIAANDRDATLVTDVQVEGAPGESVALTGDLVGADGKSTPISLTGAGRIGADGAAAIHLSAPVTAPKLWSAEKPNLYYLVLRLTSGGKIAESVQQRFGFRQVTIKNNVVLWNGKPIKATGTCRHDFWADKGFALTDKEWTKDLQLMKDANINAIRTSHYNHAARFLELCEEKGFYILDEVPFCWINEKNDDPAFAPALLLRAADTIGRDKNRPCVLAWSIGNENGLGKNSQTLIDFVEKAEPTRPAFVSQQGTWGPKGQSFDDMHYPTPADVDRYLGGDAKKIPAVFSEHPHIFYQQAMQDYDPGTSDLWSEVMIKTWEKLWASPTILGSFIWEWQNQGIADKNKDKTRDFYLGPNHMRQENDKGVMDAFRNPKPEWWIVKMAYSPIGIGTRVVSASAGAFTVPLTNHYSFTDAKELACHWSAMRGDTALQSGVSRIACAPGASVSASFPAPAGATALTLEFVHPDGRSVTLARLPIEGAPTPAAPAGIVGAQPLTAQDTPDALTVRSAQQTIIFDKTTGGIRSWRAADRDLLTGAPILNLGESDTVDEKGFYHAPQPPVLNGAAVASQSNPDGSVRVTATSKVLASAAGDPLGTLTTTYDIQPNAQITVAWRLDWTAPETRLWEAGLKLPLPASYSQMGWSRDSYFTVYPAGHIGEPSGTCHAGDTLFRASKRDLHWMTLTDANGAGLALLSADTPLTARAQPADSGITLLASRDISPTREFSGPWVSEHDIVAAPGKPLSGSFVLRAVAGR
ncbi:hypothetical protein CCAX7_12930 [Capsulimonas corticalis]|uniref:beta-galactosidase n=1 Tax=Capsulimonas corticalis TaxID=2219043 RepID=A0A402D4M9_9BACT|nr:glycoside hydrolase family 2 TIM barrel-domain containing protein [Capsulimonas corticalis]BDI29242.1 hypothetical protein CCAX7_12930 [Capsulimonas corticalis]